MAIVVRLAGDDDIPVVARLRRMWCEENEGRSIDDTEFEDGFAAWWREERATRTFFVSELDGRAIG